MKLLGPANEKARGTMEVFELNDKTYVVVSTVALLGYPHGDEEETMVFPANEKGDILDWCELDCERGDGSRQRVLDRWADS